LFNTQTVVSDEASCLAAVAQLRRDFDDHAWAVAWMQASARFLTIVRNGTFREITR